MNVSHEEEIGPQMRDSGLMPETAWKVILTHFHTDHAGGIHHFPNSYFLAGDTSYSEELLLERHPDGVSPSVEVAVETMGKILRYAEAEPTIYLPCHDPLSGDRLMYKRTLTPAT
jgi:glyoxylase-like metal-dependent hydrolase (beta-lactamase superfamily II)